MEKIKVVFVDHRLVCGGAEKALFDLISLMDRDRFDITVFAQYEDGAWEQKFRDAGINVIFDYSCRQATWNPVKKLENVKKKLQTMAAYKEDGEGLLDICYPQGADIVVSYSTWDRLRTGFAKGAKTVKYIHGNMETNQDFHYWLMKEIDQLPRFDRFVCVSNESCAAFKKITGLEKGVEMHFNPLDSEHVICRSRESVALPEDLPLVCAVGRLAPEKGYDRLIVLHKRLVEQGVLHRLVIVGDGPDRDYLERVVQAMDAEDTVILAGYQSNPYPYMAKSKFLVCSSFTEGLPVIAMEALCLGIPIVSAVPSIAEVFGGEVCGLITENDNRSLEAGVRRMLTDQDFYAQAKAGAERRSAFFDGKRMVKEVEEMFIQLMNEKNN